MTLDTIAAVDDLEALLASPAPTAERLALAQERLYVPHGPGAWIRAIHSDRNASGLSVLTACHADGHEALAAHQLWGLFSPARPRALSAWASQQLAAARARDRVKAALEQAAQHLPPGGLVRWMLLPGDPSNVGLMKRAHGLSAGAAPGAVVLWVWPSPETLQRLAARACRALVVAARAQGAPLRTLADWLAAEGLGLALVQRQYGASGVPEALGPSSLAGAVQALTQVATQLGISSPEELCGNTFGAPTRFGDTAWAPAPAPLSPDEQEYSRAVLRAASQETNPARIAGYLYGDELCTPQGHAALGVAPYAGLWVAAQLGARLSARGLGWEDAFSLSSSALADYCTSES